MSSLRASITTLLGAALVFAGAAGRPAGRGAPLPAASDAAPADAGAPAPNRLWVAADGSVLHPFLGASGPLVQGPAEHGSAGGPRSAPRRTTSDRKMFLRSAPNASRARAIRLAYLDFAADHAGARSGFLSDPSTAPPLHA